MRRVQSTACFFHKCLGVDAHSAFACRGLHVGGRGSVELKLPMPARPPPLSRLVVAGRTTMSTGAVYHRINKDMARPDVLVVNRTKLGAALISRFDPAIAYISLLGLVLGGSQVGQSASLLVRRHLSGPSLVMYCACSVR
jgi:hypothetical protein